MANGEAMFVVDRAGPVGSEDFVEEVAQTLSDAGWYFTKDAVKSIGSKSFRAKEGLTPILGPGLRLSSPLRITPAATAAVMTRSPSYEYLVKAGHKFTVEEVISGKTTNKKGQVQKIGKMLSGTDLLHWNEVRNQILSSGGTVVVSARPSDILTASTWSQFTSCHRISFGANGEHGSGPLSYILDQHTAIAFMYRKKFKYPYKLWRQMLWFPLPLGLVVFSRQYPDTKETPSATVRKVVMRLMGAHLNLMPAQWRLIDGLVYTRYDKGRGTAYLDDGIWKTAYLKGLAIPKNKDGSPPDPFVATGRSDAAPFSISLTAPLCISCGERQGGAGLLCKECFVRHRGKCKEVDNNTPIPAPGPAEDEEEA